MNVEISMNAAEVQEDIKTELAKAADALRLQLDEAFMGPIDTPEKVIAVYNMLKRFRDLSGTNYEITFEENTIV